MKKNSPNVYEFSHYPGMGFVSLTEYNKLLSVVHLLSEELSKHLLDE